MFAASKTAAAAAGTPPASTDPQFNYVTMLLHGDGTNGAQNNTFVDSSTNNFTITRNGTPTQGSFSPYGDLWSNQFNGSSSGISAAANTAFAVGTGDFTIEFWANWTTVSSILPGNVCHCNSNGTLGIYITNSLMQIARYNTGGDLQANTTQVANQWDHYAFVRSGGTGYIFKNGVQVATGAISTNYGQNGFVIGFGGTSSVSGYISNLRFVKGTALYTSNFTPSTTPLTAVSGTSLLTCQSNRFRDASSNNFAITVTGTPSVQRFSPFDPAAEYSTSVIGGSGFFGGVSDWMTVPASANTNVLGGDFTIEAFVYPAAFNAYNFILMQDDGNSSSQNFQLIYSSTGLVKFTSWTTSARSSFWEITATNALQRNAWNHVAVTRSGTTTRLFVNGVQEVSSTNTVWAGASVQSCIGNFSAGPNQTSTYSKLSGYVTNVRMVKGSAVYTAAFTPPTAPLTAITNTSLLLNCVNAGIYDNAMMNDLVTVGDAKISTAVKKYGTGSMAFDGSGDWLAAPDNVWASFGTGDFTIEGWVWLDSTVNPGRPDGLKTVTVFSTGSGSANDCSFAIYGNTSVAGVGLELYQASPAIAISAAATVPTNSWAHIAFVRSGTTIYGFVNGVRSTLGTTSSAIGSGGAPKVGASNTTGYSNQFKGYIDDLRITKGVARYTANFTPPTAPFPNN